MKEAQPPFLNEYQLDPTLGEAVQRQRFLDLVNTSNIAPYLLPEDTDPSEVESRPDLLVLAAADDSWLTLEKYVRRFNPQADVEEVAILIKHELSNAGARNVADIPNALRDIGRVGYVPIGVDLGGRIILDKVVYFPQELHQKVMQASSWRLISDLARDNIAKMHLYSVGLSVGSEMLDTAVRLGVPNFTIGDPSLNHGDAAERLTYYRPTYKGFGKTPTAVWEIFYKNPYANVAPFHDGLTPNNAATFFKKIKDPNQISVCFEEVDSFQGKVLSRRVPRELSEGIHTIMIGDVGPTEIIFTYEAPGDSPFGGRVAEFDPQGDQYGANLANLPGLFASLAGTRHIPPNSPLLELLNEGAIGNEINTVPQARGAVELAGAAAYSALIIIAENRAAQLAQIRGFSLMKNLIAP